MPQLIAGNRSQDHRGWFSENWNRKRFTEQTGLFIDWEQDSTFASKKGVLRGPHFYPPELGQYKLTRCVSGLVQVIALSVLPENFGTAMGVILDGDNEEAFLVPPGWAHGVLALESSIVSYKTNVGHRPDVQKAVAWYDPGIKTMWAMEPTILSYERAYTLAELRDA